MGLPRPPPRTGKIQKRRKVQGGSPRLRRGSTTSWRLGWGPEFGKRGAMKETRGWERLTQRGGGTELQPAADETRGLRDAFGLPGLDRCSSGWFGKAPVCKAASSRRAGMPKGVVLYANSHWSSCLERRVEKDSKPGSECGRRLARPATAEAEGAAQGAGTSHPGRAGLQGAARAESMDWSLLFFCGGVPEIASRKRTFPAPRWSRSQPGKGSFGPYWIKYRTGNSAVKKNGWVGFEILMIP